MKKCSFCGKEHSADASMCEFDREPLIRLVASPAPPPPPPASARFFSAKLHLLVSVVAVVGSITAWFSWAHDWQRKLLGDEIKWSASSIMGLHGIVWVNFEVFSRFRSKLRERGGELRAIARAPLRSKVRDVSALFSPDAFV